MDPYYPAMHPAAVAMAHLLYRVKLPLGTEGRACYIPNCGVPQLILTVPLFGNNEFMTM
jgi:hypothetical protein